MSIGPHISQCKVHSAASFNSLYQKPVQKPLPMKNPFYGHKKVSAFLFQNSGLAWQSKVSLIPCNEVHVWTEERGSGDQSFFSLFSLRACRLSWRVFSSVIVEKVLYTHTITMTIVFSRTGIEQTKDMNMPFESKYWKLEKDLQFMAASSLRYSALYTRPTMSRK